MTAPHLSVVPKSGASFESALAKGELQLPLLPRVAAEVLQLATDEDANAQQLAQLIQSDPALAGHVLRLANSPAYRPATPFVSLQQAIARLGMNSINEIALATSLNADLFDVPGHESLLQHYWQASLLTSAWAREIARLRKTNVESSFLSGLLCGVGRPVVLHGICSLGLALESPGEFVEAFYIKAGLSIAVNWHLPPIVHQVIEHQENLEYVGSGAAEVLNVQAALAFVAAGQDVEALDADLLGRLNFYPEDLQALLARVETVEAWMAAVGG